MKRLLQLTIVAIAVSVYPAAHADKDSDDKARLQRAGTCQDARSQMEYFCNPSNSAKDSMVAIGTACTNAKNNVKEACEGIVQPDRKYEFDDKK